MGLCVSAAMPAAGLCRLQRSGACTGLCEIRQQARVGCRAAGCSAATQRTSLCSSRTWELRRLLSLLAAASCDRASSSWLLRTKAPFRAASTTAGCRRERGVRLRVRGAVVRCSAVHCSVASAHLACAQLARGICDARHEPTVSNVSDAELHIGLVGDRLELLCLVGLIAHCIIRVVLICVAPALGCGWPVPRGR